ncbi:SDR family oxidoreductase [Labrys wisconsinensis]|uniref:NAD(P)-dependent dehydrogenase (Short-subunit alcohol dehydrogenase family) n=1 Tax=Labrys wisconsinensis TaxID=425677 RepID=A0ABU0JIF1_9HYPH|nr:SDR family oxidoreductase [Labrys wisconsinensis]MDQ0474052.1 NAD(P)-dependent dehydrogenase (short-subunit alcohol dehydrogenase family) [Labrys wisconsinensis]
MSNWASQSETSHRLADAGEDASPRRSVLITGGSRGIGRETALLAARHGLRVALSYVAREEEALDVVARIVALGGEALAVRCDVAVEADVVGLFDAAEARFGHIDGVVAGAGIVAPALCLADMPLDRLRRMFDVNILGTYLTAREAARRLSRSRGGRGGAIVLLSSIASRLGSPGEFVDYAGTKGAIDTLVIGLAKELGPQGVRVNGVRPGLIETEMHASGGQPDRVARLGPTAPLGRAGHAAEVAEAILWLLGDGASYVTGAVIDVAGGR